jgi:inhibitor of KinA
MKKPREIKQFGDQAVLLQWEETIDVKVNEAVLQWAQMIRRVFSEEIVETLPAYCSLAVFLNIETDAEKFIFRLHAVDLSVFNKIPKKKEYVLKIPVCYEEGFAPDIEYLATFHGLTVFEVIRLHTKPIYTVFFLGFLPGFPYLGILPSELHTPRRQSPALRIEKGTVAIGGGQTGIYSYASPGGWHGIGRSPLQFFNPAFEPPGLLQAGDRVRFYPVSEKEYLEIEKEAREGIYQIAKEVFHD